MHFSLSFGIQKETLIQCVYYLKTAWIWFRIHIHIHEFYLSNTWSEKHESLIDHIDFLMKLRIVHYTYRVKVKMEKNKLHMKPKHTYFVYTEYVYGFPIISLPNSVPTYLFICDPFSPTITYINWLYICRCICIYTITVIANSRCYAHFCFQQNRFEMHSVLNS